MNYFLSRFDVSLEHLLSCLEPVVLEEQTFCLQFFKMDSKVGGEGGDGSRLVKGCF